LKDKIDGSLT
jgi:nucleosome binding factor SPN SPT16 subunit